MARSLGKQVVGDAQRHLLFLVQLGDHLVVFGVILEAAAGVDGAGQAKAVEFAHKLTRRVDLLFQRQGRPFCQRGIEDHRIWPGNQHAGRVAVAVTLDFAARWIWRVFGVADHVQRGAVEQGAVVKVQDKHRRVGRGFIDFVQRRHPTFGKLEFGPATHHPHPLWRRGTQRLLLQHPQRIG